MPSFLASFVQLFASVKFIRPSSSTVILHIYQLWAQETVRYVQQKDCMCFKIFDEVGGLIASRRARLDYFDKPSCYHILYAIVAHSVRC